MAFAYLSRRFIDRPPGSGKSVQDGDPPYQLLLLDPGEPLDFVFTFQRRAVRLEQLGIDQKNRTAAGRVLRPAARVVRLGTPFEIARIARVQRSIGAPDHIHEMHGRHSSTCDNKGVASMGALRFRRRYGLKECMPSTINS